MLRLVLKLALSIGLVLGGIAWVERGITCTLYRHDVVRSDLVALRGELAMETLTSKSVPLPPGSLVGNDPWGRPYQWFAPESPKGSIPDFQIYSFGENGISTSQGNDPDDINSWDDHHYRYYMEKIQRDHLRGCLLIILICGTPIFIALHAIERGWKNNRFGTISH